MNGSTLSQWVHLAIGCGPKRKLVIAQDDRFGYVAIVDFPDLNIRIGTHAETPDHAFIKLDSELETRVKEWR